MVLRFRPLSARPRAVPPAAAADWHSGASRGEYAPTRSRQTERRSLDEMRQACQRKRAKKEWGQAFVLRRPKEWGQAFVLRRHRGQRVGPCLRSSLTPEHQMSRCPFSGPIAGILKTIEPVRRVPTALVALKLERAGGLRTWLGEVVRLTNDEFGPRLASSGAE